MAPVKSYVYIIVQTEDEDGKNIISAHATEKSANEAAKNQNASNEDGIHASVQKFELQDGEIVASKPAASKSKKATTGAAADKTRTAAAHAPKDLSVPTATPGTLSGQMVVFSGTLSTVDRKSAQKLATDAGAKVLSAISKNVTLVVLGSDAGPKKLDQIEKLGIQTTDEQGFFDMIKGDGAPASNAGDDEEEATEEDEDEDMDEEEAPAPKRKRSKK